MASPATFEEVVDMVKQANLPGELTARFAAFLEEPQGLTTARRSFGILKALEAGADAITARVQQLVQPDPGAFGGAGGAAAHAAAPTVWPADFTADKLTKLLAPDLDAPPPLLELRSFLQGGLGVNGEELLPVTDYMYAVLQCSSTSTGQIVEPVVLSRAHTLAEHISGVLKARYAFGTESVLQRNVDLLLWNTWDQIEMGYPGRISLFHRRNSTEDSITVKRMRPDFLALVRNVLLFKGEDKTEADDMELAEQELINKMRQWRVCYHGALDYMMCYAMAGDQLQFLAIDRDNKLHRISDVISLSATSMHYKLKIIRMAFQMYRILKAQYRMLPRDVLPIGRVLQRDNGTVIEYFDTFVEKRCDLSKQPALRARRKVLSKLYAAVRGCPYIIHTTSNSYPRVTPNWYIVRLEPVGLSMSSASPQYLPSNQAQLRAAARCILSALGALHSAGWGHGDLRWDNMLLLRDGKYVVIDLECAVRLGNKPDQPLPAVYSAQAEQVLQAGCYSAATDLYLLGRMLQDAQVGDLDDAGSDLITKLLQLQVTLEAALEHSWFSHV